MKVAFVPAARMESLPTQFFADLVTKVGERVRQGHDVINLGQGNPDLPTPPHIVAALQAAAEDPAMHRYPPFRGLPECRQAIAAFYARQYGVRLDPDTEVAVLFGGKSGLVEISQIYLNPGDVALVPDPGYPDYWSGIALAGGQMERMPLMADRAFLPDLRAISAETWRAAKLMFLNYPNNPTGAAATLPFFAEVAEHARRHDVVVVHDFAYGAIGFDGVRAPSFLQAPSARDVGIEVYTLSKTYNMAGWRVAFAVGQRDVIAQINLWQDHLYCSIFPGIQKAAIAALAGDQTCVDEVSATYERRRDAFVGTLRRAGIACPAPGGSFFVWVPVPDGQSSQSFADQLLLQADVAVAPGVGFGEHGEGYVRVGLLASEQRIAEAARRIAHFLR